MIKQIFKEVASTTLFNAGRLLVGTTSEDKLVKDILHDLDTKGWFLLNRFIEKGKCQELIDEMEVLLETKKDVSNYWTDYNNSDQRFYRVQEITSKFDFFLKNSFLKKIEKKYLGVHRNASDNILVNKVSFISDNLGSGGGWHRDSPHSNQFKAIAYLADVNEKNGPFQFIDGSHKFWDSLKMYVEGLTTTSQYRFTEGEIDAILERVGQAKLTTFTANAGDVILVNTKGIHRGKPIEEGSRYATTIYYNDKNF